MTKIIKIGDQRYPSKKKMRRNFMIDNFSNYATVMAIIAIVIMVVIKFLQLQKSGKTKKMVELKKGSKKTAHGVIFGKKGRRLIYSPEEHEGHIGVFSASGTGKTSAIGIGTLRSWRGTSYTIDISGDICKNCPDMPQKIIHATEHPKPVP